MRVPTLLLILLTAFAATNIYASTWTVTKTDDTNDGVCDTDCSLREAIGATANGDTVVFSPLFDSARVIYLLIEVPINNNITITGPGRDLLNVKAIFNWDHEQRIFRIASGTSVRLSNFTISDGCACGWATDLGGIQPFAGAIYNASDSLTLENMLFDNNRAYTLRRPFSDYYMGWGGAICCGYNVSVINSEFTNNFAVTEGSAITAGAIDITDSHFDGNPGTFTVYGSFGGVTVSNSSFSNSRTDWSYSAAIGSGYPINVYNSTFANNGSGIVGGGALDVENCVLTNNGEYNYAIRSTGEQSVAIIKNTVIANNLEFGWGGIGNYDGILSVINSTVSGNLMGIMNEAGTLFVTNSTISGNSYNYSSGDGAGIYNKLKYNNVGGHVVVTNSTITNNNATRLGGGIFNCPSCSLILRNSIVSGNTGSAGGPDVSGMLNSEGNNLISNITGSSGWIASDLLNANPMLGPLADNGGPTMTRALLPGSPAIDAGNNTLAFDPQTKLPLTGDQRGFARFFGNVDIGAYERQATISGVVTYGNAIGSPTSRFVSNVMISGAGAPNVFANSLVDGTYTLSGFGSGAYTVAPSKTGEANGISSFDSARVAQHAAGLNPLTGNQMIVADVSGNGGVSSFDAAQIARYAAGLNNTGSTGNWLFIPANRTYAPVTANITGEDYVALLMGEVSGNWMPTNPNHLR